MAAEGTVTHDTSTVQHMPTAFEVKPTGNCYIKNVVLFEGNSILPLPECREASGVESVWGEVSQESPTNRGNL